MTRGVCEYCGEREATVSCEVCGSSICEKHKKEYGCKVCGGENRFQLS
ncbi:MAG: orotate phosphoribosyltransferase [Candidatus Nanohaloarchaea archaeon]